MARTCKTQLGSLDLVNFAIDSVGDLSVKQLAAKYGMTVNHAQTLLKTERVKQIASIANRTLLSAAQESMNTCLPMIQEMTMRYMTEALKEERIDNASLASLFTVWNTVMDKMIKVHEVTMRQQEMDARKAEMQQAKAGAAGLMAQFLETLRDDPSLDDVQTVDVNPDDNSDKGE